MKIKTKIFGEIEIEENKTINFPGGIIGFPDMKEYILIFEEKKENTESKASISWLQSLEEPSLALPVVDPLFLIKDYEPTVEDELLKPLGEIKPEELLILTAITVPADIEQMTVNLRAPIVINSETRRGCQVIAENTELDVRYPIYELLKKAKGGD